jgi:hypothetical protein
VRALVALVLVTTAMLSIAAGASAESSGQVRALAARAEAGDAAALERLRAVREIDGRAMELGQALAGARGDELESRLRLLAEGGEASANVGAPAREAAAILDDERFRGSDVPRPFHGVLSWLGERLREIARPFRWLADRLPGSRSAGSVLLGAILVVVAAAIAFAIARRRAGASLQRAARREREGAETPEQLEREAEEAERRGDLELALRLRFRAGLLRLALAEAIPGGERTNGELRPILDQEAFDRLAAELDVVVYGGRSASAEDVEAARQDWQAVLEKAGAR